MALTTQEYANLADHAYENIDRKKYIIDKEKLNIKGIEYKVLEQYSDKNTDYQGTIYQRVDTGEIVVAHRGTYSLEDAIIDYGMVTREVNLQIPHALALTERALELAKIYSEKNNVPVPEVSITGHSLAGALSEIDGYEHGLKVVTFNGYGSVGLGYQGLDGEYKKVPENYKGDITNHMMAGDIVNIANPHIGREVLYSRQAEIDSMRFWGYDKEGAPKDIVSNNMWYAIAAQTFKHDVHSMKNFVGTENQPSILSIDALETKSISQFEYDNKTMHNFRNDIKLHVEPIVQILVNIEKDYVNQYQEKSKIEVSTGMSDGMDMFLTKIVNKQIEKYGGEIETAGAILGESDKFKKTFQENYVAPIKEEPTYNPFIPREAQKNISERKDLSESEVLLGQILDIGKHPELNSGRFRELCEEYAMLPEKQVLIKECISQAYDDRALAAELELQQQAQNIINKNVSVGREI